MRRNVQKEMEKLLLTEEARKGEVDKAAKYALEDDN